MKSRSDLKNVRDVTDEVARVWVDGDPEKASAVLEAYVREREQIAALEMREVVQYGLETLAAHYVTGSKSACSACLGEQKVDGKMCTLCGGCGDTTL